MENQEIKPRLTEEQSFQFCEDTKNLNNAIQEKFLLLGKRLLFIKRNNLAEPQYGGFDLFLSEIKMKQSTAEHIMRVYRRFCEELNIPENVVLQAGGYTRLYELLPLATTREKAIDVIKQASLLPSRETIKTMVKEQLTGKEETCPCPNTFIIEVCKDCGKKIRRIDLER